MDKLLSNFKIEVPSGVYIKDPETSDLGKRIVGKSIELISELGFEQFNFKKLGTNIGSNESSIYRYFESKHHLLMYLTSWYWVWTEYQIVMETFALKQAKEKLTKTLEVVTRTIQKDSNFNHINEILLQEIIINENSKCYLTKEVDNENSNGFFMPYKRVIRRIAQVIENYDHKYTCALSLASTIVEGALQQHFFKQHFKTISNCNNKQSVTEFYTEIVLKVLTNDQQ